MGTKIGAYHMPLFFVTKIVLEINIVLKHSQIKGAVLSQCWKWHNKDKYTIVI